MAFQIIRNDITKVCADAIVNTANPEPVCADGTDRAIYEAAGVNELLKEREKIGAIEAGNAVATPAFSLNAKYIIHTVGPAWEDGDHGEYETVQSCYENCLRLASELDCESIAFPLIATGEYGFPKAEALRIAVSVFRHFLSGSDMQIILVVSDEDSFVLPGKIFTGIDTYIDQKYVTQKKDEEYLTGAAADIALGSIPPAEGRRRTQKRGFFEKIAGSGRTKKETAPLSDECVEESGAEEDRTIPPPAAFASMAMSSAAMAGASPAATQDKSSRSLDELMAQVGETWQESLFRLIDEKGYTDTEVYKRANVDRKLFSKIRSNNEYQPKKITAVAFALALRLSLDETKDLLARAGYALSPSSRFDLIIEYFIEQEVYDTYTINLALFDHRQPLLGE